MAPFQGPAYALRQVLETYLDGLPAETQRDEALRQAIGRVLGFPLVEYDTRMSTAAVERTAAGVFFFGIKQDDADDTILPRTVVDLSAIG